MTVQKRSRSKGTVYDLRKIMKKPQHNEECPYCDEQERISIPYGYESELYARCYKCGGDWVVVAQSNGGKP